MYYHYALFKCILRIQLIVHNDNGISYENIQAIFYIILDVLNGMRLLQTWQKYIFSITKDDDDNFPF